MPLGHLGAIVSVASDNDTSFRSAEIAELCLFGSRLYLTRCPARVSLAFSFFAGGRVLRADCKALVFLPEDDDGYR